MFLVAAILLLPGCADMQRQKLAEQFRQDSDAVAAECEAVVRLPAVQPLVGFIPIQADQSSLEQLSDTRTPDEAQQRALSALNSAQMRCRMMQQTLIGKYYGDQAATLYDEYVQKTKAAMAELWAGRITFGSFNTQRASLYSDMKTQANALAQEARQRAQAADEARRNAVLQGLAARPPTPMPAPAPVFQPVQPYIIPTPAVRTTTCGPSFGGYTTCTTR
ncbi:hypothetical protein [Pigmentiphaga soli]